MVVQLIHMGVKSLVKQFPLLESSWCLVYFVLHQVGNKLFFLCHEIIDSLTLVVLRGVHQMKSWLRRPDKCWVNCLCPFIVWWVLAQRPVSCRTWHLLNAKSCWTNQMIKACPDHQEKSSVWPNMNVYTWGGGNAVSIGKWAINTSVHGMLLYVMYVCSEKVVECIVNFLFIFLLNWNVTLHHIATCYAEACPCFVFLRTHQCSILV